ncbi:hypothetical protein AKJ16_DCAP03207 [Drosera capensis]
MSEPNKPAPPPPPNSLNAATSSTNYFGQKVSYPNPPDPVNPDAATLKEQWRFAIRQYSKWYSHAWGTAILAGVAFFALGSMYKYEEDVTVTDRDEEFEGSILSHQCVNQTLTGARNE